MNFKPQDLANAGIGSISLLANATIDGAPLDDLRRSMAVIESVRSSRG